MFRQPNNNDRAVKFTAKWYLTTAGSAKITDTKKHRNNTEHKIIDINT
jgi:hypothetical protein